MIDVIINNTAYSIDDSLPITLMDYLRDELGLKSVKDGCNQGACGTCTVIIDGVAQRSCSQLSSLEDDIEIVTIEGLSEREKDVYDFAFAEAGAVQCGFCIPGMVLSSKALLDIGGLVLEIDNLVFGIDATGVSWCLSGNAWRSNDISLGSDRWSDFHRPEVVERLV